MKKKYCERCETQMVKDVFVETNQKVWFCPNCNNVVSRNEKEIIVTIGIP